MESTGTQSSSWFQWFHKDKRSPWWRHQMETFSALLANAGNTLVTGEFPLQRPVTRNFEVFFDLRLNKRLSKQSWGWWFETLSCSLWLHCNAVAVMTDRQHATIPDVPYGVLQGAALSNGYSPIRLTCPATINHRGHEHQYTLQSTFIKHSRAEFL